MRTTEGRLLGGRLRYAQPEDGYRTGIEPVLLAAAVPARPGQRVLEGGTGAGAGLMCLAARVVGVTGVGVEVDPAMAALARANLAANGMDALSIVAGDVTRLALAGFDHAFANPPWHDPRATASPVASRRLAKQAPAGIVPWIGALARALRPGGTLALVLPVASAQAASVAMAAADTGPGWLLHLLPKQGRAPKLVLLGGVRGAAERLEESSIVLHEEDGRYAPEVEAVLRGGAGLPVRAGPDGR